MACVKGISTGLLQGNCFEDVQNVLKIIAPRARTPPHHIDESFGFFTPYGFMVAEGVVLASHGHRRLDFRC